MDYDELMDELKEIHEEFCDSEDIPCNCSIAVLMGRLYGLNAAQQRLAERQGGTLPQIRVLDPNTQTHSENGVVYFRPAPKA